MTLAECLTSLEISDWAANLSMEWEKSQSSYPNELPFLKADFLKSAAQRYLSNETVTVLLAASERIKKNPAAVRLLWHFHYLVVLNYEQFWLSCYQFPELPVLHEDARNFYLLLALSGVFHFGDVHQRLGIPESFSKAVVTEIRASVDASITTKGLTGMAPHYSGWWQGFFSGRLYRLGRLSFLIEKFNFPYHIFENEKREVTVLAKSGLQFSPQGLIQLKGEKVGWESAYTESEGEVIGSPISADGFALKKHLRLVKTDWRELSHLGDPIISVHISAGEPLDIEACTNSFVQARVFFEKYFPNTQFRLFTCDTWFLDPQLQRVLSPTSNIVRFQKRYFLAPSPMNAEFVPIRTIFGKEALVVGYENVEHATSLQKAAAQLKRKGGILRHGYGFLPWNRSWLEETH